MLRLVVNQNTLTGSISLDTAGTIDDYIDSDGAVTLVADRQLAAAEWANTLQQERITSMLFGGTSSDNDNGYLTLSGGTSWAFEGLQKTYIFNGGTRYRYNGCSTPTMLSGNTTPYVAYINTVAAPEDGDITFLPSSKLDVDGIFYDCQLIMSAEDAGDVFSETAIDPNTPLYTLNQLSAGTARRFLLIAPSVHHCNPNYYYKAIDKLIYMLYTAYNSLILRMLAWKFSRSGFPGFGVGLSTYKNYQALVSFINLYSWQNSFVLRASSQGSSVNIVFGYVETECSHSNLSMELKITLTSYAGGADTAYRQPYAIYLTGIDSTTAATNLESNEENTEPQPAVTLYQKTAFGMVLPEDASTVEVDGSGRALHPDLATGYDLFGGGAAHITIPKISVGQHYLVGITIAPVSGGLKDYTQDSNYCGSDCSEQCTLTLQGVWHASNGCDFAKTVNAMIKPVIKGVSSSDPGYIEVFECSGECGVSPLSIAPPCTSMRSWKNEMDGFYYTRCKVTKIPTHL